MPGLVGPALKKMKLLPSREPKQQAVDNRWERGLLILRQRPGWIIAKGKVGSCKIVEDNKQRHQQENTIDYRGVHQAESRD